MAQRLLQAQGSEAGTGPRLPMVGPPTFPGLQERKAFGDL